MVGVEVTGCKGIRMEGRGREEGFEGWEFGVEGWRMAEEGVECCCRCTIVL